jgi:benzodiazapine receptor
VGAITIFVILGDIATQPNLSPWFAGLVKPPFYSPNWVFGPVNSALCTNGGCAVAHLAPPGSNARTVALILFFLQLALNAAWSWMFFWAHSPLLGHTNIVPQVLVIIATLLSFARVAQRTISSWRGLCSTQLQSPRLAQSRHRFLLAQTGHAFAA